MPAMDDLEAVRQLLREPPPSAATVAEGEQRLARLYSGDGRRAGRRRRWRGWLAPVAAAAAVTAAVATSLAISAAIGRGHGPGTAAGKVAAAVARGGVPRYFVDVPGLGMGPRAMIGATATGAVLGTVTVPTPRSVFTWAAGAGNRGVFVLAVRSPAPGGERSRFYRLALSRSGRPGALAPLPIPAQTRYITALALSPNGGELAVATLTPASSAAGAEIKLEVFSLATGNGRTWIWPDTRAYRRSMPSASALSWEADNRTLLFEGLFYGESGPGLTVEKRAYLLDTAAPGGSLAAAGRRIPVPRRVALPMFVTGDGTTLVAPTATTTHRPTRAHPTSAGVLTITEFSVATGKPVLILDRRQYRIGDQENARWVGASGTSLIVQLPGPVVHGLARPVAGIQDGRAVTLLPPRVQREFQSGQITW